MTERARRRLIGALVLIGVLLLLAECLPEPEVLEPISVDEATGATAAPPQRVIYDLRAPPPVPTESTGAAPRPEAAPKPRPVLQPLKPAGNWYVQLGTYSNKKNAQAVLARMQALGQSGQVQTVPTPPTTTTSVAGKPVPPPKPLYRVRIGPYASIELARPAQALAIENGFAGAQKIEVR